MVLLEIPQKTIDLELIKLDLSPTDEHTKGFIEGARTALTWLRDRRAAPSDLITVVRVN